MPVFVRGALKVLYIHVPKTGGNAIMTFFASNGFDIEFCDLSSTSDGLNALRTCSPQHYHGDLLAKTLRLNSFNYTFMTVRDPVQRLKSEFLWRVRSPTADSSRWAVETLSKFNDDPFLLDNHIRPQHEFSVPKADVFRMEDGYGEAWAAGIASRLGIEMTRTVPHTHVARTFAGRSSADVFFDERAINTIGDFYREDFDRFGYVK